MNVIEKELKETMERKANHAWFLDHTKDLQFHNYSKNPEYSGVAIESILKKSKTIVALSNNLSEWRYVDKVLLLPYLTQSRRFDLYLNQWYNSVNHAVYKYLFDDWDFATIDLENDTESNVFCLIWDTNKAIIRTKKEDRISAKFVPDNKKIVQDLLTSLNKDGYDIKINSWDE